MDSLSTLQHILMPNNKFGASTSMYINGNQYNIINDRITIYPGGRISFDTYYNSFSTILWRKECGISNVSFMASGYGKAYFRVLLITDTSAKYEIISGVEILSREKNRIIDIDLSTLKYDGLIYIEILSQDEKLIFTSGEWVTSLSPRRFISLGITVTHFNRKEYILPAIKKIKNEILNDEKYNNISFIIVDNSRNITTDEAQGIKIIQNKNTGGAGGFMRGLIEYMNHGNITHVLFMDDDVSCEPESIKKAYAILSFVIKNNSAVSGSLFMESSPDVLIEKSGYFDTICRPIFHGRLLNNIESVVECEMLPQRPNYGGWWFFAFPVKHVKYMAFPFFVRGDDILFGMMNKFNIISTNGIACYSEDFATKVSAMTWYLDTRNHIVNMLLFKKPIRNIIKTYSTFYLSCLLSHQYGSVKAVRLALKHVFSSPTFWEENIDLALIRKEIGDISSKEQMVQTDIPHDNIDFRDNHESRTRRVIRIISINGILLPLKNKIIYQSKGSRASLRQIFRYKKIFFHNKKNNTGYIAEVSRTEFFSGMILLISDCISVILFTSPQRKKYSKLVTLLTSVEFWKRKLFQTPNEE
ncbi:TPA: glycosyltransferase family 2 protein [Salmonella enterica subsp. enterica serovar Welikade]|nr:glycosyltransferase family 2 protein [Salmonella enterica]EKB5038706.1 glycosyltransferase [Salmonella enterica]EME1064279.1 glycosyltransferase [Salmonella enterica]HEC8684664.1 glycosyltransferase [Salmonella enterica subsp. enterica serovar Oranienburg]